MMTIKTWFTAHQNNHPEQSNKQTMAPTATSSKVRPSPTESATVFEIGTHRRGNDGNMYVVTADKNGKYRWTKDKENHKEETQVAAEVLEKAPKRKAQPKKAKKTTPVQSDASASEGEEEKLKKEPAKPKKSAKKTKKAVAEVILLSDTEVEEEKVEEQKAKEKVKKAKKTKAKAEKKVKATSDTDDDHNEKKKHVRKSPAEPAKNYEIGETMTGLDGNEYIVKATKNDVKRWFLKH